MGKASGWLFGTALALGAAVSPAAGSVTSAGAAAEAPSAHAPSRCNSGLTQVRKASDEFDRAPGRPAPGEKWRIYDWSVDGQRSRELYYRADMVRVKDGALLLSIVDEPQDVDGDGETDYPAGGVESTFDVPGATARAASCVEVRSRGFAANVAGPDVWDQNVFSAVWLQTRPLSHEHNPNAEIDIQEFFETDKMHAALHTWESPPPPAPPTPGTHVAVDNCRTGREDETTDPPGMIDDCHVEPLGAGDLTERMATYAVRREIVEIRGQPAGLLTFYFDGRPVWTRQLPVGSPLVTDPRHLILSTQGNPPGGPGLAFPKVAAHDWVRTYH